MSDKLTTYENAARLDKEIRALLYRYIKISTSDCRKPFNIKDGLVETFGETTNRFPIHIDSSPISFSKTKSFDFGRSQIKTMSGFPNVVDGNFNSNFNEHLTTLEHGPERVIGRYNVVGCKITSLQWLPKVVGGSFGISWHANLPMLRLIAMQSCGSIYFHTIDGHLVNRSAPFTVVNEYRFNTTPLKQRIWEISQYLIREGYEGNALW
jgi:hypothetical protein